MVILESMPTLSTGEHEGKITRERVLEILSPFQEGLLPLVDDTKKKEWLQSKRIELDDKDGSLDEAHQKLLRYAEQQVNALGLGEDTPDILGPYFYVHGLMRYRIV